MSVLQTTSTLDTEALGHFLAGAWNAEAVRVAGAKKLTGGAIQENWLLDLTVDGGPQGGRSRAVLRADAQSGVEASLSRADEHVILSAVHRAGVRVPEPLCVCNDDRVIGRSFFVTDAVNGDARGTRVVRNAALDRDALAKALASELAKIHTVAPDAALRAIVGAAPNRPMASCISTYRAAFDQATRLSPVSEYAMRWLERGDFDPLAPVFCHRDFRTGNYMVEEGCLTAILDWEFAGWSSPLEDIGWFCAKTWRFGADTFPAGGLCSRETFIDFYERRSGREIARDAVLAWELLANVRWALIAQQQADRLLKHGERSLELALIARRIHETEFEMLRLLADFGVRAAA